jgi:trehalose/maltose hydrolase-like predicted phosphorylase
MLWSAAATGQPIKQADTIMLGYPLNWNVSYDIRKHDLEVYETLTSKYTPAMTWSWFTIGFKFVNELNKMNSYFLKSYQDYTVQPFKIWTEHTESSPADQQVGNVNFLPGHGGFLQSLIYGFAGVRIRPDLVEFHRPSPPHGSTRLVLRGFHYLQNVLTVSVERDKTTVYVNSTSSQHPLILRRNSTAAVEESLTQGTTIVIASPVTGFYIYSARAESCPHPRDYIFMPWGYSPWVSHALTVQYSLSVHLTGLLSVLLTTRHRTLSSFLFCSQ